MRKTKSAAEAEEAKKAEAAATATAQQQKEQSEKKKEQQGEKNKTTTTTTTTTTSEIKIKKKKNKNKKRNVSSSSSSFVQRHVVVPITDVFRAIKSMNYRQLTLQMLSLTLIVTSALMIWKSLCLYTHSESPVVVVLSGSMEPAFKRGDILFLSLKKKEKKTNKRMSFSDNSNSIGGGVTTTTTTKKKKKKKNEEEEEERGEEERTRVGEIIVFSIDGREIPIVHRVIKSHYHPYSTASLSSSSSSSSSSQSSFDKADDDSSASSGSIGSGSGSSYDDSDRDDENSSLSSPSPSFKHEMLTKGDNNYMDDIGLYAPGQKWLNEKHVMGRTVGYLPHVGKATILMNDHPMIKYALILVLGLLVISGKEG